MDWALSVLPPIVLLAGLGALLPIVIMKALPDTQKGLLLALLGSAGILTTLGALIFAWAYSGDAGARTTIAEHPLAAIWHFARLGLRSALAWAPILLLTGLVLGQGIEERKGKRIAARDKD